MKPRHAFLVAVPVLALAVAAANSASALRESTPLQPRLVVLPWLVIDRTTNRECSRTEPASIASSVEARRLSQSAQAALDGQMHRLGLAEMISRKEWEPEWRSRKPAEFYRTAPGCAVCASVGDLIRFDPAALQQLAGSVRADYVWLGVTVTPLSSERSASRPDECCQEALGEGRDAVLARSSALLWRASDGEIVWQRDARRFDRDVLRKAGKIAHSPENRRRYAVEHTARALAGAFKREYAEALK